MSDFFFFFFLFFCRIWKIRCTLLSRGDARCWRISMTPEAPSRLQSTSISLFTFFLPCLLTFTSFHDHTSVQSYFTPSFCFTALTCLLPSFPSPHSHKAAGPQSGTIVSAIPLHHPRRVYRFLPQSINFTEVTLVSAFQIWSCRSKLRGLLSAALLFICQ